MKIALVTDAWLPHVNGVVTTLVDLVRELGQQGHEVDVIHPGRFNARPGPWQMGVDLASWPYRTMVELLDRCRPHAIHLATEGPLGWAARRYCLRRRLPFTTAFHAKLPEMLQASLRLPLSVGYAWLRWFHGPSAGLMVPTQSVMHMLEARGFRRTRAWTHGVDTRLFGYEPQPVVSRLLGVLPRPITLYAGRLSAEKNLQDFLDMDLPGSKVVCGTGPMEATLRGRYPEVHWMGTLPRHELAEMYASADVFVFPSRAETFGHALLESMACGTPVACYPVDGPSEILGKGQGGAMANDLHEAVLRALTLPRHGARLRALDFGWAQSARQFAGHLVPIQKQTTDVIKAIEPDFIRKKMA
jgi:glycosyltransferase involved in cell wall biosynthesis